MSLKINPPQQIFYDKDGDPLDAGYIFIGEVNQNPETHPVPVYWDVALTQPAPQPIRTLNGYPSRQGVIASIYTSSDFSITIRNKKRELVLSSKNGSSDGVSLSGNRNNGFRKNVIAKISDNFSASDALKTLFNYEYFYIRGVFLDERTNELIVANMPKTGGDNRWGWYVVYDATTAEEITHFSAGELYGKSFAVVYEGGSRFMYTTQEGVAGIGKFDITSWPGAGVRLAPVQSFPDVLVPFISERAGQFLTTYDYVTYNTTLGNASSATWRNSNMQPTSVAAFPIGAVGTVSGESLLLPKMQGMAAGDGCIFASFGGVYLAGDPVNPQDVQGIRKFSQSGALMEELVMRPDLMIGVITAKGYPATRVEYEGMSVTESGRLLSTLHYTSTDVLIIEEYSDSPNALDFTDCSATQHATGDVWYPRRSGRGTEGPIMNPVTGVNMNNLGQFARYMQDYLLTKIEIATSSTGTTIYECDGVTAIAGSVRITIERSSVTSIFATLAYTNFQRRLLITTPIDNSAPTQAEIPVPRFVDYVPGFDNNRRAEIYNNVPPPNSAQLWRRGDRVINNTPSAGGWSGWVNVNPTSPTTTPTWKGFGLIEA